MLLANWLRSWGLVGHSGHGASALDPGDLLCSSIPKPALKLLVARGRQCTGSTHGLGSVRALNTRLGCAMETLRSALNALAAAAPEWLRAHADPTWPERYAKLADEFRSRKATPRGAPTPSRSGPT